MKQLKILIILFLTISVSACNSRIKSDFQDIKHTQINKPIFIEPTYFEKAILISKSRSLTSGKIKESSRVTVYSREESNTLTYLMSFYRNMKKIELHYRYDEHNNKTEFVSIKTADKNLEKYFKKMQLSELFSSAFPNNLYKTELLTGRVFVSDISPQAKKLMDNIANISNSEHQIIVKQANARHEVLGLSKVKGRDSVAISVKTNMELSITDRGRNSHFTAKGNGVLYIDVQSGMILNSESFYDQAIDGQLIDQQHQTMWLVDIK